MSLQWTGPAVDIPMMGVFEGPCVCTDPYGTEPAAQTRAIYGPGKQLIAAEYVCLSCRHRWWVDGFTEVRG